MSNTISIEISPTTGGSFDFVVNLEDSICDVKREIAKKLKVSKEMICLLHGNKLLDNEKKVKDYNLNEGARIVLAPRSIETGLVTTRPEQSVLDALEGLNESQVADFLSGKSPLNLTMRLGDHVMLIQLQLSKGQHAAMLAAASAAAAAAAAEAIVEEPRSLFEASRNLTNTLKRLSSHVSTETTTAKEASATASSSSSSSSSSVNKKKRKKSEDISNHMQHHGKGVYSGTFSGTLNPALQDGLGAPRKHVSTIVHILNDLLGGATTSTSKKPPKKPKNSEKSPPSETITTAEARAEENEQLRIKMEQLKEQLRIRRNKFEKSNEAVNS